MSKMVENKQAGVLLVLEDWELALLITGADTTKPREETCGEMAKSEALEKQFKVGTGQKHE